MKKMLKEIGIKMQNDYRELLRRNRIMEQHKQEVIDRENLRQERYEKLIAKAFIKHFGTAVPGFPRTLDFFVKHLEDDEPRLGSLANQFLQEYYPEAKWEKYMDEVSKIDMEFESYELSSTNELELVA